ncbi:unnamed protein product, partial [Candidula unifasciata]
FIRCECNTVECKEAGKTMCTATKFCYTELYQNRLNRGCDPAPLACENRKPVAVDVEWPAVHCCNEKDLCNKYSIPTATTADKEEGVHPQQMYEPQSTGSNCSNLAQVRRSSTTKIINPTYIAVPVAGVCVLLGLIIFAMYLLRRRSYYHHHDNFHSYHHDHAAQNVSPSSKGNRCTDSERSSSGSETKLFLQS